MSEERRLMDLRRHLPWLEGDGWRAFVRRGLEDLLGLPRIWEIDAALDRRAAAGEEPFEAFFDLVGIGVEETGVTAAIPREGGVVVIANHPYGGADALILATLCARSRADMRILANAEVEAMKALRPLLLPVEIMGGEGSARRNLRSLREACAHLSHGGLLVVFPAGAVSYWQTASARVEDPPWPDHVARLIARAQVPVVPVCFHGRNDDWYQILAKLHPYLRSGFIPRAFLAMRGRTVRCSAGAVIAPGAWPDDVAERTEFFRRAVRKAGE